MRPLPPPVLRLAERQGSVITAAQLIRLGVDGSVPSRQLRAGHWQRPHHGVYVLHSGPLSWRTNARAALLYAGPGAALSHHAAGFVHELVPRAPTTIEVSVPASRRVTRSAGLRIRLRRQMPPTGGWLRTVGAADTVVDLLALRPPTDDAVALLCRVVRAGVRAERILDALGDRSRAPLRLLATQMLADVAEGIESPLEYRYHHDVERRHGLPRARLQRRERLGRRWIRADTVYESFGVRVELDGELAHPGGRTDADVWRDNAVLILRHDLTLRYRWWHVRVTPCETAAQVATALRRQGWAGIPRPCGPTCRVAAAR